MQETISGHRLGIVEIAEKTAASELISRVFSQDEPLVRAVGQTRAEFSPMLGVLLPAARPERLTAGTYKEITLAEIALTTAFNFVPTRHQTHITEASADRCPDRKARADY